ncbi:MAG: ATP phosphoribosyltransferase regulatory subunit, partial [Hyphomicrobiaceae bacterium]
QAQRLVASFTAAGAAYVAPAVIQPAALFLDVVGESLRGRTYVFTDPDGRELCLRPDLTVPTCRVYLERDPKAETAARFCYNGPVFRYQSVGAPQANAREFRQAGIEIFGVTDVAAADVDVLSAVVKAVRAAGLRDFEIRTGDVGLLHALLDAIEMPARWRRRLQNQFWRPDAFRAELKRLTLHPASSAQGIDPELLASLELDAPDASAEMVAQYLEKHDAELMGTRSIEDITTGLLEAAADLKSGPMSADKAQLIQDYVVVKGAPHVAVTQIEALVGAAKIDIGPVVAVFKRRLEAMKAAGIKVDQITFAAEFGRRFEYYTGFVFDIVSPSLGVQSPVASGGRYDGLLKAVGAPRDVAAVGAAIYTERLLSALAGGDRS